MGVYKQEFINRVKKTYPDSPKIIEAAENGEFSLGKFLDDGSEDRITYTEREHLTAAEVDKKQKIIDRKLRLYREWYFGDAYTVASLKEVFCPLSYVQNLNYDEKHKIECDICRKREVNYAVGSFKKCKCWKDKKGCWKLYNKLIKP